MKRLLLAVPVLFLMAVSPTLDPPAGTVIGEKATIKNRSDSSVTVSGTTGIRLATPITLIAQQSLDLVWDGSNWVLPGTQSRFSAVASFTWDFPSLDPVTVFGLPCSETNTVTITGAAVMDKCRISSNLGADGGTALLDLATLDCRAVAGGAVGRLCMRVSTDGGSTYNLHDAGFSIEVSR